MKFAYLSVLAVGCYLRTPVQSSRALLGPEGSEVIFGEEPQPAALDIVKQLAQRGYMIAAVERDDRGITMRFKGDRRTVSERLHPVADAIEDFAAALDGDTSDHYHPEVDVTYGSVFYVRVEGRGPARSWVSMVGRAIRDGAELCTPDPDIAVPCVKSAGLLSEHPGDAEAEVIVSVFAELRLRGVVISEDPMPRIAARQALERCKARRQHDLELASRVMDSKARANIVRALPTCDEAPARAATTVDAHGGAGQAAIR